MVCKPIWFYADSTISCLSFNVFICFVSMSICWCFPNDSCMLSTIWYVTNSFSLCTAGLHITMIIHICLAPPILITVWHPIWGECFILFVQRTFCVLHKLVPEVWFSCDRWSFDVFAVSGDDVACFCDSCHVGPVVLAMVTSINHCVMSPQSTILSLNCYSRPYWKS